MYFRKFSVTTARVVASAQPAAKHLFSLFSTRTGRNFDVVIVGGGVVGSSIAYHMKKQDPRTSVCVVERDPTYKAASTPLSAGSIRQQFSIRGNVEMSLASVDFLRNAKEHLKVSDDDDLVPDIQLVEGGYLFLSSTAEGCDTLRENFALQTSLGADVVMLEPPELETKFPWLNTSDGLQLGVFGQTGEGWFDPWALLHGFRRKALSMGVEYVEDDCSGFVVDKDTNKVTAVQTKKGDTMRCGAVVNAAGAWATRVCEMAGIPHWPVRPRKRMIFVVHWCVFFDCVIVPATCCSFHHQVVAAVDWILRSLFLNVAFHFAASNK